MSVVQQARFAGIDVAIFSSVREAADHILAARLGGFHNAIAINPEKIVRMREDPILLNAAKSASINYPDGIGVCLALGRKTGARITRIPGIELWEELMSRAAAHAVPVFIVGGSEAVNARTVDRLRAEKGVQVAGHMHGYFESDADVVEMIRESRARIVSVAMGSPRQEVFIERCKQSGLTGFFMGVGGSYDVFSGVTERAPKAFREAGLEWFYRLLRQPTRVFRQRNLVRFALLFLRGKL